MFEVFASMPENLGPESIADYARRGEAIGFDGLFVPDDPWRTVRADACQGTGPVDYCTTPTPAAECGGRGFGQQDGAHDLGLAGS